MKYLFIIQIEVEEKVGCGFLAPFEGIMKNLPLIAAMLCALFSVNTAKAQDVLGVHSYNFNPGAAATQVVFAPSANTYGAVLKTAVLFVGCGAPAIQVFAVNATDSVPIFALNNESGDYRTATLTRTIYLPAGTGITLTQQNAGCGAASITYDILN